jgi:hypothetical protein
MAGIDISPGVDFRWSGSSLGGSQRATPIRRRATMRYMLLIYGCQRPECDTTEHAAKIAAVRAFTEHCRDRGAFLAADPLHTTDAATTVLVRIDEVLITDGPFAETAEQLGGYYLLDCKDLDEALELARPLSDGHRGLGRGAADPGAARDGSPGSSLSGRMTEPGGLSPEAVAALERLFRTDRARSRRGHHGPAPGAGQTQDPRRRHPLRRPRRRGTTRRLAAVLTVLYLIFTEGYLATAGEDLHRSALCAEAIRLGKLLAALMPDEPEVLGLLALMLLADARRDARTDAGGDLVLPEDQHRTRWDCDQISEGLTPVESALRRGRPGPYQLQAAIAAVHSRAPSAADTDWAQTVALYAELLRRFPSPVFALNDAVAVAMVEGPARGLELLEEIRELDRYRLFHAARGDLLRRLDRTTEAIAAYTRAHDLVTNPAEKRFLEARAGGSAHPHRASATRPRYSDW